MVPSLTATVIRAAQSSATIVSHTPAVTAWARRYFGPWWSAVDSPPLVLDNPADQPVIAAEVDPDRYTALAERVIAASHEQTLYARSPLLHTPGEDGTVHAVSPTEGLAYHAEPASGRVLIVGTTVLPVNLAASRLAREAVRAQLHRDGWTLLHASAVTRDGQAVLSFGGKGAGKTTTALTLACSGWALLANDRVFARSDRLGVQILPWPAAAAVGLGLLNALGLYDLARDRLLAGEQLHPTQDQRVTAALQAGRRAALHEPDGRELKAQVSPDQLASWLGLCLATSGRAATLLFPTVTSDATPTVDQQGRDLAGADFFTGRTEDRYPDIFRLVRTDPATRAHDGEVIRERLIHLPRHCVTLGHDTAANTALLTKILKESW